MKKHFLIALDSSATSSLSLDYAASLFAHERDVQFTLLNCQLSGSSILPEPENDANSLLPGKQSAAALQKCSVVMGKAEAKLRALGIPAERIQQSCQVAGNIAATIRAFADQQLVDAIIVARRGVGVMGELFLGSVSSTLFDKCQSTPLWIIDGTIQSDRFLVPVDGTPSSLMAVDHLSHIFSDRKDISFHLFHARGFLSSPPVCKPEDFYNKWGKEWCDKHLSGYGCMFTGPTEILTEAGIPKEQITTLPEPTSLDESSAIISAAIKNRCGTIVLGRRSIKVSKGFFGGVSKRTVRQAENLALWIVG